MKHVRDKLIQLELEDGEDGVVDIVEAVPVYADQAGIHEFLKHEKERSRLRRHRARVKMYSEGSPFANPRKRARALEHLDWYAYLYEHHMSLLQRHHTRHHEAVDSVAGAAAQGHSATKKEEDPSGSSYGSSKAQPLVGVFIVFDESASVERCLESFADASKQDLKKAAAAAAAKELWLQLDDDGDGDVSYGEFSDGMRKRLGRFTPSAAVMKKMYEAAANAQKSDGGGAKGDDDIGGRKLHLERSPDPENVLWENMRMLGMPKTRACSQCTTKLVQVVLLVVLAAAAAFVSTFVIDGTDADLSVCDLHLKAAYHTDEDELQNTGCDYIQNELSWVRPRAGSADRKSFDSKCDAAWPGSKFAVLMNGEPLHYLTATSVSYADVFDPDALEDACYDGRCPGGSDRQCPCIKFGTGRLGTCTMDHIDVDTCAGLDSGNIRIDEAAAASCYCYFDVIKPNVKQRGAHRGLRESLEESGDLCRRIIWHSISLLRCNIFIAAFCVAATFLARRSLKLLIGNEGHVFMEQKAVRLFGVTLVSEVVGTVVIPILVHGDADRVASETWREWIDTLLFDTAKSNAQLVYLLFLVLFLDALLPLAQFALRVREMRWAERSGGVAMQTDLDAMFRGKPINLVRQYVAALCHIYLAFIMGPGLPLLVPMTAAALALRFLISKYLLLHFYCKPEFKMSGHIFKSAIKAWATGIIVHLFCAWYTFGNRNISRRIETSRLPLVQGSYECAPVLGCALVLILGMFAFLPKDTMRMNMQSNRVWSEARQAWVSEKPKESSLFTGPYEGDVEHDFELTHHEFRQGWRKDQARDVKYKVRPGNRVMKTWEVIGDLGLHSYRRSENRRYRQAIHAVKKRLPAGHQLLQADTAPKSPADILKMLADEEARKESARQLEEEMKEEALEFAEAPGDEEGPGKGTVVPGTILTQKSAQVHPHKTLAHFGEDEGLGEDFRSTPWVEPSKKKALSNNRSKLFQEGKANVWGTTIADLNDMGTGIGAYFMILASCARMLLISSILAIPHLLVAHYGEYNTEEESKTLQSRLFAHSSGHHSYVDPSSLQRKYCGTSEIVDTVFMDSIDCRREWLYKIPPLKLIFSVDLIRAKDASAIVAAVDILNSIIIIIYILWMRRRLNKILAKHSREGVDVSSFSVLVRGLPEDATRTEILEHFSNLYKLDEADWAHAGACCGMIGRKDPRLPEDIIFPSGIVGERALFPVAKGAALNAAAPELYDGKWVAEVCVVRPLGNFIRTLRSKSKLSRRLLEDRARIKKFSSDSEEASSWFFSRQYLLQSAEKRYAATSAKIEKVKKALKHHHKVLDNAEHVCKGAFVVFNHEESLKRCLGDYSKKPFWHRMCFGQHKALRFRGTYKLRVTPADKPGNILWENINIGKFELWVRRVIALFITFSCLAISFAVILYASMSSQKLQEDVPNIEMCTESIPSVYGADDKAKWTYDDSKCPNGFHYITFEDAVSAYQDESWSDECTAPCISLSDKEKHICSADDGNEYEFAPSNVVYCYCIDKMADLIQKRGFYEGPRQLLEDDVCGNFARDFVRIQGLLLSVSIIVPVVNELLKAAIFSLGKYQRKKTTTGRSISVAVNTFYATFINTAILLLVINGKLRFFFGRLNGHNQVASSDYDEMWYATTGIAVANVMITNMIVPQIPYVLAPIVKFLNREFTGAGLTQLHLDEVWEADPFQIEQRCAQVLFTLACTLTFSAGLPILLPIGFVALTLSYWLDKYLLLRYFKRPTLVEGELGKQLLRTMPILVMLHAANAAWIMSYRPSQGYHGEVENQNNELDGVNGNIGGVFDAHLLSYHPGVYNRLAGYPMIGFVLVRMNRLHVIPTFALFVLLFLWYFIVLRFLGLIIRVFQKCGCCSSKDAGKALASLRQFNPPYTENFEKMIPDRWSWRKQRFVPRSKPHLDKKQGWRISDPDENGHTSIYRLKLDAEDTNEPDEQYKTFEVVKAHGLHSYEIRLNEAYKEVFIAKDALVNEPESEDEGPYDDEHEEVDKIPPVSIEKGDSLVANKVDQDAEEPEGESAPKSLERPADPPSIFNMDARMFGGDKADLAACYVDLGSGQTMVHLFAISDDASLHYDLLYEDKGCFLDKGDQARADIRSEFVAQFSRVAEKLESYPGRSLRNLFQVFLGATGKYRKARDEDSEGVEAVESWFREVIADSRLGEGRPDASAEVSFDAVFGTEEARFEWLAIKEGLAVELEAPDCCCSGDNGSLQVSMDGSFLSVDCDLKKGTVFVEEKGALEYQRSIEYDIQSTFSRTGLVLKESRENRDQPLRLVLTSGFYYAAMACKIVGKGELPRYRHIVEDVFVPAQALLGSDDASPKDQANVSRMLKLLEVVTANDFSNVEVVFVRGAVREKPYKATWMTGKFIETMRKKYLEAATPTNRDGSKRKKRWWPGDMTPGETNTENPETDAVESEVAGTGEENEEAQEVTPPSDGATEEAPEAASEEAGTDESKQEAQEDGPPPSDAAIESAPEAASEEAGTDESKQEAQDTTPPSNSGVTERTPEAAETEAEEVPSSHINQAGSDKDKYADEEA
jgi:hypothetical protein